MDERLRPRPAARARAGAAARDRVGDRVRRGLGNARLGERVLHARDGVGDEDRAEHGQAEAAAEVAHGLRHARHRAVGRARGAVERVGADRAERQPRPGAGERQVDPLRAEVQAVELLSPTGRSRRPRPRSRARPSGARRGCRGSARPTARRSRSRRRTRGGTARRSSRSRRARPARRGWRRRTAARSRSRAGTARCCRRERPCSANSRIGTSGSSAASSKRTNAAISSSPATRQPHVATPSQPHALASCRPSTDSAHAHRDQRRAAHVDARVLALGLRLGDQRQHDRDDRDRDVDPEDRPPRPLRQEAAERAGRSRSAPPETEKKIASALPRSCTG